MKEYVVCCPRMAVWVKTNMKGKIHDSAPITRKFIGQHLFNLRDWMKKWGEVTVTEISRSTR
jgi:hypothetical protein